MKHNPKKKDSPITICYIIDNKKGLQIATNYMFCTLQPVYKKSATNHQQFCMLQLIPKQPKRFINTQNNVSAVVCVVIHPKQPIKKVYKKKHV